MVFFVPPTSGIHSVSRTQQSGTNTNLSQQDFALLLAQQMRSPDLSAFGNTNMEESSPSFFSAFSPQRTSDIFGGSSVFGSQASSLFPTTNQSSLFSGMTPSAELSLYRNLIGAQ